MNIYSSKKVVAIGGGHGLGRMLAALKDFGSNATGIVATTDNGGSTGRIRELPRWYLAGDTRNCISQLITEPSISSMMFEYRFRGQRRTGRPQPRQSDAYCWTTYPWSIEAINLIGYVED